MVLLEFMEDYKQKLEQLKWLKMAGIDYFFTNRAINPNSLLENIQHNIDNQSPNNVNNIEPMQSNNDNSRKNSAAKNMQQIIESTNITPSNSSIQAARAIADKVATLAELRQEVENFTGCELKNGATNTVFGDGNPEAKIMFVGEAPGANEDRQGIPFCGESGKLLDSMLETINISRRHNAYITNTIFWRPPANRRPTPEEIDTCRPFVEKHIALIRPKLLIIVGATAATSLLGKHQGITNIRKNSYNYTNRYLEEPIHMMAIFHPAYLLRQPGQKKATWFDLLKIQKFLQENGINY